MTHRLFSALSLATLLLACAHDNAKQGASEPGAETRAEREAEQEGRSAGAESPAGARDTQRAERVEVPKRRAERDRLASASGEVPDKEAPSKEHEADNSGVNARDREEGAITPMDQGNGEIDLDLTQRIRKAVMADDSLSFTAKNAKIITRDGHVTLRGPVKSKGEKETLYKAAVSAAGVGRVTNELAVDAD